MNGNDAMKRPAWAELLRLARRTVETHNAWLVSSGCAEHDLALCDEFLQAITDLERCIGVTDQAGK